ncbi:MAG: Rrf2 family transcriptional regulator [Syntrophales bacterium]|nr:Rrf2 family transcriptional regulator [Syntrophales bacterium]
MKLSTRGRYGLRLIVDLAIHAADAPVFLKDIAQRQDVSEKYLWNLINPLKTAGLVVSVRGPKGGYLLGKSVSEITIKDILAAVEDDLSLVDCVNHPETCSRAKTCIFREFWGEVASDFSRLLSSRPLEDLVRKQKQGDE